MALPVFDTLCAGQNRSPTGYPTPACVSGAESIGPSLRKGFDVNPSPRMSLAFRIALTAAVLAWTGPALGQTCEPQHIGGSITPNDGSTAPTPTVELCAVRTAPEPGWACGNTTISNPQADGAEGSWVYNVNSQYYLVTPYYPGSNCHYESEPPHCLTCDGSFSIPLFARYGNIAGHVTYADGGDPADNVNVVAPAAQEGCGNGLSTLTDPFGNYSFTKGPADLCGQPLGCPCNRRWR